MSIANNIKQLRKRYDLTQEELGQIAGVSDKAVSTWENGLKIPRMGCVEKIALHFNIPKSSILDDEPIFMRRLRRGTERLTAEQREEMMKLLNENFDGLFNDETK